MEKCYGKKIRKEISYCFEIAKLEESRRGVGVSTPFYLQGDWVRVCVTKTE